MYKLSLKRRKKHTNSKKGFGELLNSLHFFLVNKNEVNIAWKYYKDSLEFIFYSESEEDLNIFKSFLEESSNALDIFGQKIMNYKDTLKSISFQLEEINENFNISGVSYCDLSENSLIYYMKTNSNNDRVSTSRIIKKINYIINFKKEGDKILSPLNKKLERLFKLMNINEESDLKILESDNKEKAEKKLALLKEIKLRMDKGTDLFYIDNIYYSNQKNRKNKMYFKEIKCKELDFNFKTNRYGLSTNELKFPIPG